MSKRTEKQGRPTVERDPATYLPQMRQRQRIMRAAAERWDDTRSADEVVIMVTQLRTLLGDEDRLVDRVRSIKRSVLFFDSFPPEMPRTRGAGWMGAGGLTLIAMNADDTYVAPLCHAHPEPPQQFIRFNQWWRQDKPVMMDELQFSREFVIHEAANTDGVHVSPLLDRDYVTLTGDLQGVTIGHQGSTRTIGGVVPAAVRQIAWETDRSLTAAFAMDP